MPGEVVAWTGSFMSRRELLGIKLRWSYAPAEVKVLTSADSGNFEEASGWRRTARTEPSFEETIMFATPASVKAVKVLMRGAKPWGYFGLSTVAAVAAPYSFMLVSGAAAIHEQCVVSTPAGLSAKPCVDAIVAGDGHEVFALTSAGSLQDVAGRCVALEAGKVEFRQCSNVGGVWEMTAEGQVKQGNMCLALGGPGVVAKRRQRLVLAAFFRWPCQSTTLKLPLGLSAILCMETNPNQPPLACLLGFSGITSLVIMGWLKTTAAGLGLGQLQLFAICCSLWFWFSSFAFLLIYGGFPFAERRQNTPS